MKIAIIKYNAGNIQSVQNALERLNADWILTDDKKEILAADKVIFPGVGEASTTMDYLRKTGLLEIIPQIKVPFLGICLGMQLMCAYSEEGDTKCIGIFEESVRRFKSTNLKVPHMGWNQVKPRDAELFNTIDENANVYFVHSFYAETGKNTLATTIYGIEFASAMKKNNFYGVQFHPEKSSRIGEIILQNFLKL